MAKKQSSEAAEGEEQCEKLHAGSSEDSPAFDPMNLVGEVLDGRYELVECIGRGGMGVVYLASQNALERDVVVKVLPPSFVDDKDALARFEREARGMSRLQHPHIVSIYDFGYHDDQAYIVMEYVQGCTLRDLIKSGKSAELTNFGSIALQILEGIGEAHSLGMVHRDIKPANIMLTERRGEQNYVKILDFGLAKLVKGSTDVTKEQTLVGSVSYLAPEQIMGNDTDQRVDVYALGVLFYYMLSGEKPFSGEDDVAVLYQHVHNHPERLESKLLDVDIPRTVIELIHQALSKNPDNRPHDAGEFLAAMKACLESMDISAPHISGEFKALRRSAELRAVSPEDPSERLARERHHTPIHQPPPGSTTQMVPPTPTPSSLSSQQMSWVTGEHLLKVQKQNRLRNILLGVLGAFLIGGLAIFFYMRQAKIPAEQDVRADIEQAVALIDEQKLGQAENALKMASDGLEHHPGLKQEYLAARDALAIEKLLAAAEFHVEEGDVEEAVSAYKKVLGRAPHHEAAREQLRALRAEQHDEEQAASARGSLTVTSTPPAMVFVDDLPLGETPIDKDLSVGEHHIEVRKQNYDTFRRTVEIEEGGAFTLDVNLDEPSRTGDIERRDSAPKAAGSQGARPAQKDKPAGDAKAQTGSADSDRAESGSSAGRGSSKARTAQQAEPSGEQDEPQGPGEADTAAKEKNAGADQARQQQEEEEPEEDDLFLADDESGAAGDDGSSDLLSADDDEPSDDDGLLLD